MVLATKPEVSSNFQAIMADCSDLDSDSASECPSKRKSLQLTKASLMQHGQRSLTLFQMLRTTSLYNTENNIKFSETTNTSHAKRG